MNQIAERYQVSPRSVQNINKGTTYYDSSESYPLRVTGQMIGKLRQKLSIPSAAAVPNPHILSPQLLDYVGFLSLLGVEINSLLEFKGMYYKALVSFFEKDLTDSEIVSIMKLRPQQPTQLKEIVEAYYNPKVKLINIDYWIKTGFIKKAERDMIYALLATR